VDTGEEIILSGSEGMLIAQGDQGLFGARRGEAGMTEIEIPDRLTAGVYDPAEPLIGPTKLLIRRWVEAIRDGAPSPSPSFADGVKVQEVLEGAFRSGTQGRWIDTSGARWPTAVPHHVGF
jgi:predicted dehydrogenase